MASPSICDESTAMVALAYTQNSMAQHRTSEEFLNSAEVAKEIFALRPDYRALIMVVDGIQPAPSNGISEALLLEAEASARARLAKQPVTELPHIAAWREAYRAFGAKPNKTRNSLEALTRRAEKGLPRVNQLTDIYNAISVKHQIPFGGEDLDKYSEATRLIRATGNEDFVTNVDGKAVVEHPDVGEAVWTDGNNVTCRHWNWRQSPRTALGDETTRALFIVDALGPVSDETLKAAADELAATIRTISPYARVTQRIIAASA